MHALSVLLLMQGHLGQTFGIVVELISSIRDHFVKYLENVHINNSKQKVVVVACRNGMYYGLHANSGRRIWASRLQHGTTLVTMEPYPCYRGVMEDTQASPPPQRIYFESGCAHD